MISLVVRTVALLQSAARAGSRYCPTCRRETPHAHRPAGSWEEWACVDCGNVQAGKVGQ